LELIGISSRRQPAAILQEAVERIASLKSSRCRMGISPHAPYSTLPELLRLSARTARRRRWRLCTHVAESAQEFEMFGHGRGQIVELNMFEEVRALSASEPSVSPREILRMATTNGARALGWQGQIGQLSPGACADLIAIPFAGKFAQAYNCALQHRGNVAAS